MRKHGLLLFSLLSILILMTVPYVPSIKAQELTYEESDTKVIVHGKNFEATISKLGGVDEFYLGGSLAYSGFTIRVYGPGWSGGGYISEEGTLVSSKITKIEHGIRIETVNRWEDLSPMFFEWHTVTDVYEGGLIVMNVTIVTYEQSDYAGMCFQFSEPADVYIGKQVSVYSVAGTFTNTTFPAEPKIGEKKGWVVASVTKALMALVSGPGANMFIAFTEPVDEIEVTDDRYWGGNTFRIRCWFYTAGKEPGTKCNIVAMMFAHNLGAEFNSKIFSILQGQAKAYDYVRKVEPIAKSTSALKYIEEAKAKLRSVVPVLGSGNADEALKLINDAVQLAGKAYRLEAWRVGSLTVILPLIVVVIIAIWGIRKWRQARARALQSTA